MNRRISQSLSIVLALAIGLLVTGCGSMAGTPSTSQTPSHGANAAIVGISCALPGACTAIDSQGGTYGYIAPDWTAGPKIGTGSQMVSISCWNGNACRAIDSQGNTYEYSRPDWTGPTAAIGPLG